MVDLVNVVSYECSRLCPLIKSGNTLTKIDWNLLPKKQNASNFKNILAAQALSTIMLPSLPRYSSSTKRSIFSIEK